MDQKKIELWNVLLAEYTQETKRHDSAAAKNLEPNIARELNQLKDRMPLLATRLKDGGIHKEA